MELYRDDQTSATECSSTEKEHLLEGSSTQRSRRPIIFSLPYIISLFTLINTLLLSFFFVQTLHQPAVPEENQSPNIHNSQALWQPPEHRTSKIFQFDPAYDSDPSAAVEKAWTQLIPKGKGYIGLPATMDLPDLAGLNKTWEGNRRAAISVFHQLHCLYLTRDGFFAAKEGRLDETQVLNTQHLIHCWEYLRQCIMCSADTTLEWIGPDDVGTTGWGYEHTCKDFDAIYDWAEARRWRDLQTIH